MPMPVPRLAALCLALAFAPAHARPPLPAPLEVAERYVSAADPRDFERATLAPVASFAGRIASQTDGIALHAAPTRAFPHGALFAVHEDESVAAFDLGEVARALKLDPACAR